MSPSLKNITTYLRNLLFSLGPYFSVYLRHAIVLTLLLDLYYSIMCSNCLVNYSALNYTCRPEHRITCILEWISTSFTLIFPLCSSSDLLVHSLYTSAVSSSVYHWPYVLLVYTNLFSLHTQQVVLLFTL